MNELARTKIVCKYTDKIFLEILKNFRRFKTELDIADFIDVETKKRDCITSFRTISASAESGAEPHHRSSKKKLKKGFCVIDFGLRYKGVISDMTRTVYIGKASKEEKKIYNLVLDSQKKAMAGVKSGAKISSIDLLARTNLEEYKKFFIHRLGHGIGRKVHMSPSIGSKDKGRLKAGMMITVEPGVYLEGKFGIRIEDDCLVTKKGVTRLTKSSRKLFEVKTAN